MRTSFYCLHITFLSSVSIHSISSIFEKITSFPYFLVVNFGWGACGIIKKFTHNTNCVCAITRICVLNVCVLLIRIRSWYGDCVHVADLLRQSFIMCNMQPNQTQRNIHRKAHIIAKWMCACVRVYLNEGIPKKRSECYWKMHLVY